jgi:hypothetical protein
MSIFDKNLIQKRTRGRKVPCLMPMRVKGHSFYSSGGKQKGWKPTLVEHLLFFYALRVFCEKINAMAVLKFKFKFLFFR